MQGINTMTPHPPRPAKVINYYLLCNKLKNLIRTGWSVWHVERRRLESVAEHIYGVQMLAIAMQSEYHYDINLEKVILMLAVHELEEITIGDYIPFDITKEEKQKLGHAAIREVLDNLELGDRIEELILEYDYCETPEAKFAHCCDKLEADIQGCLYDEEGCVWWPPKPNRLLEIPEVQQSVKNSSSFSDAWLCFSQHANPYDSNFLEVLEYLKSKFATKK